MAVAKIETYKNTGVAKVILKPTQKFPEGCFYTDIEHVDLVEEYDWCLAKKGKNLTRVACKNFYENIFFHQALAEKILGYRPDCIDHINGLEIDNTDKNLNVVTVQQNRRNTSCKGYDCKPYGFIPYIAFDCKVYCSSAYKLENKAALATYHFRQRYYTDYDYNFFLDRRDDLDIVDAQYTGRISEEEAVYQHVMRYAKENAWYVYRYNLFDYFKQYHISVPEFRLDEQGYMIHPITGQRLCPFSK